MTADELCALTLSEVSARIAGREVSPVTVTEAVLDRIGRLDPHLNAFITVTGETALDEARTAEGEIARGAHRGPLHGVPISLKDLLFTAGVTRLSLAAVVLASLSTSLSVMLFGSRRSERRDRV